MQRFDEGHFNFLLTNLYGTAWNYLHSQSPPLVFGNAGNDIVVVRFELLLPYLEDCQLTTESEIVWENRLREQGKGKYLHYGFTP